MAQEEDSQNAWREIERDQLRLEKEFAQLRIQMVEDNLSPEETRDAMVTWLDENREEWASIAERRAELFNQAKANQPAPVMPTMMPVYDGEFPEDFLSSARGYFQEGSDAAWHNVDLTDQESIRQAQSAIAGFLNHPDSQQVSAGIQEAHNSIRENHPQRVPLSPAEISQLSPEERLEEEIYSEIYHNLLTQNGEPFVPENGQGWHDKLAQIHSLIEEKSQELQNVRKGNELERLRSRRDEISNQLESISE